MSSVLAIYYSQSGDVSQVVESLIEPLKRAGMEVVTEGLKSCVDYPFPWKSIPRFFEVMPNCLLGAAPEIHEPKFDPNKDFDLVILAYQVWFLSPSLPIQGFLRSPFARVLRGKRVVTVCVSRNMWHSASETMKSLLQEVGALHTDNVCVTHQGPPWATFVTVPRAMFFGRKDRLWRIFPPAGIHDDTLAELGQYGTTIAHRLNASSGQAPLLVGFEPVKVIKRYVIPELLGWYLFSAWARVIQTMGKLGLGMRRLGVYLFVLFLLVAIIVGIPAVILTNLALFPFLRRSVNAYARRLQRPADATHATTNLVAGSV